MRLRSEPGFRQLYDAVRSRLAQPAAPADG